MSFLKGFWGFMIIPPIENSPVDWVMEIKPTSKVPKFGTVSFK
jgi:hypothetical protein